jgi:hypothetical protein
VLLQPALLLLLLLLQVCCCRCAVVAVWILRGALPWCCCCSFLVWMPVCGWALVRALGHVCRAVKPWVLGNFRG